MSRPRPCDPTRRAFLSRLAGAGAMAAGVGAAAWALHDPDGPSLRTPPLLAALPDWRVPPTLEHPVAAMVTGSDRQLALRRCLELLGGIDRFVRPGERVLVKANVAYASPARLGATIHPDTVLELVRLCLAAGAVAVTVIDNPIADPHSAFRVSGVEAAASQTRTHLWIPRPDDFRHVTFPGTRYLIDWPMLIDPLLAADRLISVAPVKDHHLAGASLGLTNAYGFLGGARAVFHEDIHGLVRDLAVAFPPTLAVLDGMQAMIVNGPRGGAPSDLKPTRTMIAGTDPVAVDALGVALLGKERAQVPYLALAEAAGAGTATPDASRVAVERST